MKAALTTLLITAIVAAYGQALDDSDLSKLAGEWTGSLTYTDYSDDKSKVTLSTDLTIVDKNGKLKFRYVYTEPGGGEEDPLRINVIKSKIKQTGFRQQLEY